MIRTIVLTLASLSAILAEPPSTRYVASSVPAAAAAVAAAAAPSSGGSHADIPEAKPRGFSSSLSDTGFDSTAFGSGPSYSSSGSSEGYSSPTYSHSSLGSSPAGYSGSPAGYSGSSAGYSGSSAGYSGSPAGYSGSSAGYSGSSAGYSGSSAGYSGSAAGSAYSGSGFTYSPSLSYNSNPSNYGSSASVGYSSGPTRAQNSQSRPTKQPQSLGAAPSYSPGHSTAFATPLSHNEIEEQSDPSDPVKYEFSYEVNAPESGSEFGHRESRSGGVIQGQYHVLLPDGRIQTVDYLADKAGYRPTVSYQQTDRVASQPQQHIYSRAQPTAPMASLGLGSPQATHGTPVVRQAPRTSSSYSPVQRQPVYSTGDYHSKSIERVSEEGDANDENSLRLIV